ncbi:MAG: flavodoxin [Bacillota bacterium]|nr:flavodoxin [Bacillota bacterium]
MRKICFVNGSPKEKNSASQYFIDELCKLIDSSSYQINEVLVNGVPDYEEFADSDALVFVFPLYVDSLPSPVLEFLVNLEQNIPKSKKAARVYAVVNCGFFEGIQNRHAVRIIRNFSDKLGYKWRFGIGIGGGPFIWESREGIPLSSKVKRPIYETLAEMAKDIDGPEGTRENLLVSPKIPRFIYITASNSGWPKSAKAKGLTKKQLYARPFAK